MAGTIIVDRIESDASYASSINVAAQVTFSNTVSFSSATSISSNVGIGSSSPRARVDVNGSIYTSWADTNFIGMQFGSDPSSYRLGMLPISSTRDLQIQSKSADGYGVSGVTFHTGTSPTERMRIDSNGRVTMPYQPFFYASRSGSQTGYNSSSTIDVVIVYNTTTTNTGSHFNISTGKFTAPIAGNYIFHASAYSAGSTFTQNWLVVNGNRIIGTDWVHASSAMSLGFWLIKLAANDTVGFHAYNGAVSNATINDNAEHTYFKGYLLS